MDVIARFRQLHTTGCFVMPNPWDVGSARLLAGLGFPALATTSAGLAWSCGRRDNGVPLDDVSSRTSRRSPLPPRVPVNGDFEGGFARDPGTVAKHVAGAARTGIAGLSIEDSTGDANAPLLEMSLAVDRIRAARHAIDESGTGVVLTGRSEGFIVGRPDLAETIRRLTAYAEAGADCLYAPGPADHRGGRSHREGRRAPAGERARGQRIRDGRGARCRWRATHQCRRCARPRRVDRRASSRRIDCARRVRSRPSTGSFRLPC